MLRVFAILLALFYVTAAPADTPGDGRLKVIANTKIIKIAYRADATPFSFLDDSKQPVGYSIDVCRRVADSIQKQLGLDRLKVEWVPATVSSRFSAVAAGQADMECGSSTVTLGRMKEVDFSNFIFVESTGVVVSRTSNIRTFTDMGGKKIAAIAGTTNEKAVVTQLKLHKIEATIISVKDRNEGIAMLEAGNVDGYASDKLLLVGARLKDPTKFVMLPDDLSIEPYAIVLPRGNWALRLAVNTGLAQIYRTGEVAGIFEKWFHGVGLQVSPVMRVMYGLGALNE
jgi:glutamate/aspartate transport system substrate-binding protein